MRVPAYRFIAVNQFRPLGLDQALKGCPTDAKEMLKAVLDLLKRFTDGAPAKDDRTLLAAKFVTSGPSH